MKLLNPKKSNFVFEDMCNFRVIVTVILLLATFLFTVSVLNNELKTAEKQSTRLIYPQYVHLAKETRLSLLGSHFKSNSLTASYVVNLMTLNPQGEKNPKLIEAYFKTPRGRSLGQVIKLWDAIAADMDALSDIDSIMIKNRFYKEDFLVAAETAFAEYLTSRINEQ